MNLVSVGLCNCLLSGGSRFKISSKGFGVRAACSSPYVELSLSGYRPCIENKFVRLFVVSWPIWHLSDCGSLILDSMSLMGLSTCICSCNVWQSSYLNGNSISETAYTLLSPKLTSLSQDDHSIHFVTCMCRFGAFVSGRRPLPYNTEIRLRYVALSTGLRVYAIARMVSLMFDLDATIM